MKQFKLLLLIIATALILGYFLAPKEKISKKEWISYRNENQGFEIQLLPDWESNIVLDETTDKNYFRGSFGPDNLYLMIEANLPGEVTPILPTKGVDMCHIETTTTILGSSIITDIFSAINLKNSDNSCEEKMLLNNHSINTQFCINSSGKTYSATTERGLGEYFFKCSAQDDDVYDIGLYCEGPEWSGIEGQKNCGNLFNKILSTFRIIKK